MNLRQLKKHIESFPSDHVFDNTLSEPFSWRGSYCEVALDITLGNQQTRTEALEKIERAYTDTFRGYKGGEYTYNDYTEVYFEYDTSSWSDGGHTSRLISQLENDEEYQSQEMRLTKLAFK